MPVTLPPITRRRFASQSLALIGGSAFTSPDFHAADLTQPTLAPNRVALLADTHISADPRTSYPGTQWPGSPVKDGEHESVNMAECLVEVRKQVLELNPLPAHLIINGDCAHSRGTKAEYREIVRLVEPLREAGITIHVTIGNHDNREHLWETLPWLKKERMGIQADMIQLPHANLLLLDSGRKGILGEAQLTWLANELDAHADKPALIFAHFNPYPNRGIRPIKGLRDGSDLIKLLSERKHAKAYFCGHTHEWQFERQSDVHFVNQPAAGYYFGKGHANGWLDMTITENDATLELR